MTRLRTGVAFHGAGPCFAFFIFPWTHFYFLRPRHPKPRFLEGASFAKLGEGLMALLFPMGSVSPGNDLVPYDRKK